MSKQSRASATSPTPSSPRPNIFPDRRGTLLAGVVIVLAALAAYHNSFSGPFIFDDLESIPENPTIRHLWPVWKVLSPPRELTVGGRPLLNLSLALNYAISGNTVWSYHALNLAIHILAGLTLSGIVRLTLQQPMLRQRFGEASLPLAFATALLWTVHPLQTESVTYIIQRAESLMGLFYLLTLYCFVRGTDETGERAEDTPASSPQFSTLSSQLWFTASLLACLLGMASKEVMVSAPLMVLLYDRTFVAGTFREAWRLRWRYYLGLASTWLLLGGLVATTHGRGGSAGFGTHIAWWAYALTQFRAITHYLQLSLWPSPLVLDYGTTLATRAAEIAPYAIIVLLLAAGTAFALWRRPSVGFAGCWFFAMLAPSSSVVPIATQTMAEHRMYLALAPVAALVVLGLYSLLGRRSLVVLLALAAGLGWLSAQRNNDYASDLAIWSDTVAKCPDNARAHYNLGNTLAKSFHRIPEAIATYEAALRIDPNSATAYYNLGNALCDVPGRLPDAIVQYEAALRLNPRSLETHNNFGNLLLDVPGRLPDAIAQFEAALQIDPDSATAHYNLGRALLKMPGRSPDAIGQFEATLRLNPDYPEAHFDLGNILLDVPGRLADAAAQYEAALQIDPNSAVIHYNLGNALFKMPGRLPEAMAQFEAALRLNPNYAEAHMNMGIAFAQQGHLAEAVAQFGQTVRIAPKYAEAHYDLGNVFFQMGRFTDALGEYKIAIQLKPDYAEAHNNLGNALAELGRLPEAIGQYEQALQINPDYVNARKDLEAVRNMMKQQATGSKK